MDIIPEQSYKAIIVGLSDTTDGKYKVYIPSLMMHDKNFKWCLAKNMVGSYGKWVDPNNSKICYSIGNYIPLQIGMNVEVVFQNTQFDSCRIMGLDYDQIPLNKDDQQSFYLFGKTKNGTQIYTDDARGITHVMHNKGLSNIILMDDKISLSINETSNVGTNNFANIELAKESIILRVGHTALILDESGISFKLKDNQYEFSNKEMNHKTSRYTVEADDIIFKGKKIFTNATEEVHLKSTVTRITGGQHLSLNGNVVNIDSNTNTTIQSTGSVNIKSYLNMAISCPTNISLSTIGLLSLDGTNTIVNGINTVVNGVTTAINGTTILEDSQIIRGVGAATSMANSLVASMKSINVAMLGTDISLTTALHFNDPFSGMACNAMSETLPGVAQGAPNTLPIITMVPKFDYINSVLKYINNNTDIGGYGTYNTLNGLRGNIIPDVLFKNK